MSCLVRLNPDGYSRASRSQDWHHFTTVTNFQLFLPLINQDEMFCGWAAKLHSKAERGASDFSVGPTVRTCSSTDPSGANGWRWLEDSAWVSCPTFWKRKLMHPTESCPSHVLPQDKTMLLIQLLSQITMSTVHHQQYLHFRCLATMLFQHGVAKVRS